ncbi:MAG: NUDIX domain-containing protein [Flavobacterium sp.]
MNKSSISVCNNCGKPGHMFHQCKLPITSYGIIAFRPSDVGLQFLMIRRKDSFGYIDFMRGKYTTNNVDQIAIMIDEMSLDEKHRILTQSFDQLWIMMWGESNLQYKSEEYASKKKFETIREGILINDQRISLADIVNASLTEWRETEWEFPKGRRNPKEKDLDCALREFEEETGIPQSELSIVENILPFEEMFIGSNHKSYKHKYFLAMIDKIYDDKTLDNYQKTEVSKLEWKTIDQCLESIRPYHLEKKEIIQNINSVLKGYRLYS